MSRKFRILVCFLGIIVIFIYQIKKLFPRISEYFLQREVTISPPQDLTHLKELKLKIEEKEKLLLEKPAKEIPVKPIWSYKKLKKKILAERCEKIQKEEISYLTQKSKILPEVKKIPREIETKIEEDKKQEIPVETLEFMGLERKEKIEETQPNLEIVLTSEEIRKTLRKIKNMVHSFSGKAKQSNEKELIIKLPREEYSKFITKLKIIYPSLTSLNRLPKTFQKDQVFIQIKFNE